MTKADEMKSHEEQMDKLWREAMTWFRKQPSHVIEQFDWYACDRKRLIELLKHNKTNHNTVYRLIHLSLSQLSLGMMRKIADEETASQAN